MSRKARSAASASAAAGASATSMHDSDHDDDGHDEKPSASASGSAVPPRFAGKTLYEVLGVDRTADSESIKKAYRRMALRVHPDLNHSASATEEFQYLSRCHEVLADPEKRRRYDLSGRMDSEAGGLEDEMAAAAASGDADAYWRSIFPKISLDDIESFRSKYLGSDEEVQDTIQAWEQNAGDLAAVFESVPFAGPDSVARLCKILNDHCGAKISRARQTALRKELAEQEGQEAEEAEEALRELSVKEQQIMRASMNGRNGNGSHGAGAAASSAASSGETGLALIMQQRARDRERSGQSFLANLQAKYAAPGAAAANGKKKATTAGSKRKGRAAAAAVEMEDDDEDRGADEDASAHAEPSEEEFAALQAKMMAARANKGTASSASPKKKGRK